MGRSSTVFYQCLIAAAQALLTLFALAVSYSRSNNTSILRTCVGLAIFIPSFIMWGWARIELALNGSFAVGACAPARLLTTGPYSFCRHPVYVTSTLFAAAMCLIVGSVRGILTLVLLGIPIQLYRARAEDKVLKESFGHTWVQWANDS